MVVVVVVVVGIDDKGEVVKDGASTPEEDETIHSDDD